MTIKELVDAYIRERRGLGHLTKDSAKNRRGLLMQMAGSLPEDPEQVTAQQIKLWTMTSTTGEPMKPRTVALRITCARHFFRWCADNDHIHKSPARTLETPKIRTAEPRFFETDDVRKLCAVIKTQRDLLIVLLMVQVGVRRIEVVRAQIEDVDLHKARIGVRGKGFDGEISRWLPMPLEVTELMHRYLYDKPTAGTLFTNRAGKPMSRQYVSRMISNYMRTAGIKAFSGDGRSAHALRHTFAQQLADDGVDVRVIQRALGHNQITTTERYLRRSVDVLASALEGRKYVA